ncbi:hypothetical protein NYQ43_19440 [Xanthomonas translucens pv. translucens]|nr:hypothetical protein [Xanthomonas translucens]MCT8287796.1 hypothetical protein [Xanthomonas translucens pv. translucens]MCT8305454.1 hypothetical protein [Xanthomonas translucens pv. translucens]
MQGVWPDPGAGGGHREQYWRQAVAGNGGAAVAGVVSAPLWPDPEAGSGHRQP